MLSLTSDSQSVSGQVAVGLLVSAVSAFIGWSVHSFSDRIRARRFRSVFGMASTDVKLTLGKMYSPPGCFFVVEPNAKCGITAKEIGSFCEVRGVSYLAQAIGRNSHIKAEVIAAQDIRDVLDIDFVAVGGMSNLKSCDLFANPSNGLAKYSLEKGAFVRKKDGSVLWRNKEGNDHGIIVKIHPAQFPSRTWITCAGFNEWGTSGAAYFLATHWGELHKRLKGSDRSFMAVIEVQEGKDQSAMLQIFEYEGDDATCG
jgi:hypothetical protein